MAMKMWLFFLSSQGGGDTSIAGPGKTLNFPGIQEEDIGVGWYLRVFVSATPHLYELTQQRPGIPTHTSPRRMEGCSTGKSIDRGGLRQPCTHVQQSEDLKPTGWYGQDKERRKEGKKLPLQYTHWKRITWA